jgi:asparagine synthase (glutamine-hydrolysing)
MCGITGGFRLDGDSAPAIGEAALQRMSHAIAHRGPDDAGVVSGDGGSIAARRLSIVDIDGGHQPMASESGTVWAAQNGELYNHDELRRDLIARGHVVPSRCDTAVLPHLYEEYGAGLVDHLRGKFAVAAWDRRERRGVIARDRLGIKPLYYAIRNDVVVFGSELKSVVASGLVSDALDHDAIAAYLTLGFVPSPLTPLADVRKLHPGERLVVENGRVRLERYWRYPAPHAAPERHSAAEWAEIVLAKLDESVKLRLMSDVPLGAMLSGGLDSSLIVALMARHVDRVNTFAVGFAGEESELGDARAVAEHHGARHHELEVEMSTCRGDLSELVWHLDEPLADLSSLGFLALSRLAAEHVTVALSGQGADELFGGYRKHRVASLADRWGMLPARARRAAAAVLRNGPGRSARLMEALQAADPAARLIASSTLLHPELASEVFTGTLAGRGAVAERMTRAHLAEAPAARALDAALFLDARLGLVDDMLAYFDRASMACSLEVRVPFLDHELVELCATVPAGAKVNHRHGKHVLRLAARGLVPDLVLAKRKRGFFNESVPAWLSADGGALMHDLLLARNPAIGAVLDTEVAERALREFHAGRRGLAPFLLSLVMLELWLGDYLPRAFGLASEPEALTV